MIVLISSMRFQDIATIMIKRITLSWRWNKIFTCLSVDTEENILIAALGAIIIDLLCGRGTLPADAFACSLSERLIDSKLCWRVSAILRVVTTRARSLIVQP